MERDDCGGRCERRWIFRFIVSDLVWNDGQGEAWLYCGDNPMDTIPGLTIVGDSVRYWLGFVL